MRKRLFFLLLVVSIAAPAVALDGKKAMHVGGTLVGVVPEKTEGFITTTADDKLVFTAEKGGGRIEVLYATIDALEYGQKASHRIKTAILLTPWSLFSKKRRHYVSLTRKDAEEKDQAVVFELGKDILRQTVLVLEARSGKKVEFQDDEAKKHFAK